jgi:hypothetical protein
VQPHPGAPVPPPGYPVGYPGGPIPYGVPTPYPAVPYPYGPHPPAAHPYGPPPYAQHPYGLYPPATPPRPRFGLPRPAAITPIPGTQYAVALVEVRPTVSGPSVASLVAGICSIAVSLVVVLFAALGAADGWGPAVAGAFAVLGTLAGVAGIWLGLTGLRRIRTSAAWGATVGRGAAVTGLVCASVGLVITAVTMLASLTS